ncbi:ABC transporter C family member 8 isoform X2 [Cinnamomum micranthum f. kanehirae]|uniref:ABC transporter C family member 8 isoform X2 n=1 Tax=Cinnamomum micranthum f. kanehirae TaxID=337451 RepID=A0A443N1X9_9MAGN|nr:ABC transporter C family member 8 isoform X2 [Cinnamomum micranthum f. kanehirae]
MYGYSKTLVLDDILSLESEDEAQFAYEVFAHQCDLQRKQSASNNNLVLRALAKSYMKEMRHWYFDARRFGMRMRSALMVAVYRKLLKLSSSSRRKHSTGDIVNYIAVEAYRLGEFPWWFRTTWTAPLLLAFAITVVFGTVGLATLPGLIPLIICGLFNIPLAKNWKNCQSRFMEARDQRLRATSEVLNSFKIIKLQSWEEKFKNLIDTLQDREFKWLKEFQIKKCYGVVLFWLSPMFVSSVVLAGCAVFRSAPLNASTIFTVLATLRVMSEPVRIPPEGLSMMIQVKVSLDRLNVLLLDDEIREEDVEIIPYQNLNHSVRIPGAVFGWNPGVIHPTLKGNDFEISTGQKIAICGPVGAGKSSLLYALLREIPKISGSVEIFGSIAYVSQTAWIRSGTIRDNILYGKPMDKNRYEKAIKVCALDKDINNFDHGDLTEIGQRGLNLSGGQKQRLQLARAVYNDADIYLLDDPFSAVDAHTASILFNDCVMAALEKKTVILVTHQVEFLVESDSILVMEGGQITQSGSYVELLKAGTAFEQLVNAHHDSMTMFDSVNMEQTGEAEKAGGNQLASTGSEISTENSEEEISVKGASKFQLTEDEEKEKGNVGWKPYIDYICGYYLASAREIIRINGTTKAPVMNYAAETSLGVVTIRAFTMMERFVHNTLKLIDTNATLFSIRMLPWNGYLYGVEALQNLTIFTATLLLVLLPPGTIPPASNATCWGSNGPQDHSVHVPGQKPGHGDFLLEKCQLADTIRNIPNLLDSSDEATASIDSATDAVLQRVIRHEFANCTVITVAHRVPTVTDSDMVMVLSYGKFIEYDRPSKLMETNSSFSKLVAEYWSNCKRNPMQNQSNTL